MKIILDVVLVENTDKQEFVNSFDPQTEADLWNILSEIPNCISMYVETSFVEKFKQDSRTISAEERIEAFPAASLPLDVSTTKTITVETPSTTNSGSNYMPLQFYLDSDHIYPTVNNQKVGRNSTYDNTKTISNATYRSKWTGKNVDIVTLEVGPVLSSLAGVHNNHPDFADLDNPGSTRIIPMNWVDLEDSSNNQIASNSCLSSHGMGVLSAAGGTICGFAKKSSLRSAYLTSEDGVIECINAIISWHNSKPINPETGLRNPTIMIGEYQYLLDRRYGIPIDYVSQINSFGSSVTRPGSTWGGDFTPFIENNIVPFLIQDPNTLQYQWCVVAPTQSTYLSLHTALQSAWSAGIVCINAAGNNGGVYRKTSEYESYTINIDAPTPYKVYSIGSSQITTYNEYGTWWYTSLPFGPHGLEMGIDVAAGYNSEGMAILDRYTNRGPGIDIIGLGENTWTSYPISTYADGHKWGMFSGTSCAAPTVVGKAACLMERQFYYTGRWPTPNQVKSMLISSGREIIKGISSTNWTNVPSANPYPNISNTSGSSLLTIIPGFGNGGFTLTDLCETTRIRAHFDANVETLDRSNIYKKRPLSGILYPRTRIRKSTKFLVDDLSPST